MSEPSKTDVIDDDDELSAAWFMQQIHIMKIQVTELERRLREEQGPAAFAAYEQAVARQIGQADTDNVVDLRGRLAQQRTFYGADGRVTGRETTSRSGSTLYGADGRVESRSTLSSDGTVAVYGSDGRVIGREARPLQPRQPWH
jgi:hypothetical protein